MGRNRSYDQLNGVAFAPDDLGTGGADSLPSPEPLNDTSSIGPTWPPKGTSHDRVKGFDVRGIVTQDDLTPLQEYAELLERAKNGTLCEYLKEKYDVEPTAYDRFSFRFIAKSALREHIQSILGDALEVVMPLDGSGEFDDCTLFYIGWNNPETRASSPHDLSISKGHVESALSKSPKTSAEIMQRVKAAGYDIETLSMEARLTDPDVLEQLFSLFERFTWTKEEVAEMLSNPDSFLSVARKDGMIVSAGIAEPATVPIGQGDNKTEFRMYELTEASTLEEHGGQGLYTAVARQNMETISKLGTGELADRKPAHLVLGECNGIEPSVIHAVRALHRTFAYEDGNSLGYLPQHAAIKGGVLETRFNDLFPAYITQRQLQDFINHR